MVAATAARPSLLVDATPLQNAHARRGIGTYVRGLLAALQLASAERWAVLAYPGPEEGIPDRPRVTPVVPRRPARLEFHGGWMLDELLLPRRIGPGVPYHATDPRRVPRLRAPVVATAYDLTPLHDAEVWRALWPDQRVAYRLGLRRLRQADAIVAISEQVRADVVATLRVPESTVRVVYPAIRGPAPAVNPVMAAADLVDPGRVLYVGSAEPHKNVNVLLDALALVPVDGRPTLTIAGPWSADAVGDAMRRSRRLGLESVWIEPHATGERLEELYRQAAIVVQPSRREGFGLPVIEAMARGVPVIAADIGVLREVGGDAARYVAPGDPDALASAIDELIRDAAERGRMATAGLERSKAFAPERALESLLGVYEAVGIELR